jgi:hypothetical protein
MIFPPLASGQKTAPDKGRHGEQDKEDSSNPDVPKLDHFMSRTLDKWPKGSETSKAVTSRARLLSTSYRVAVISNTFLLLRVFSFFPA